MREAFFDYFLGDGLVRGHEALDECNGPGELCGVAFDDAFDEFGFLQMGKTAIMLFP